MMNTVVHFGPDTRDPGGMARVIQAYLELDLEEWRIEAVPTYTSDSRLRQLAHLVTAATVLATRSRRRMRGVHVHASERFDLIRTLLLLEIARLRGLRRVVTIHGASFMDDVRRSPRLVAAMLRRADVVTVLSDDVRDAVGRLGAAEVRLLPNPVRLRPAGDTTLPATAPVVLFAGEIGRRKGVDVLLEAWERVAPAHRDATLLLVGPAFEPELLDRLPAQARYGGVLDRAEALAETGRAYVAVLPSRAEAMPMFILEAMAAGVPVVSTPVGAIAWLLEEGGVVVPPGDAAALGRALDALLESPAQRDELGRAARRRVEAHFSTDAFARRVHELYAETFLDGATAGSGPRPRTTSRG